MPQVSGAHLALDEPILALQFGSTEGLTAGGVQRIELSLDPGSLVLETYWPTGAPVAGSPDSLGLPGVANVLRDSILRLRQEHELSAGAFVDEVTGLANRRSVEKDPSRST